MSSSRAFDELRAASGCFGLIVILGADLFSVGMSCENGFGDEAAGVCEGAGVGAAGGDSFSCATGAGETAGAEEGAGAAWVLAFELGPPSFARRLARIYVWSASIRPLEILSSVPCPHRTWRRVGCSLGKGPDPPWLMFHGCADVEVVGCNLHAQQGGLILVEGVSEFTGVVQHKAIVE